MNPGCTHPASAAARTAAVLALAVTMVSGTAPARADAVPLTIVVVDEMTEEPVAGATVVVAAGEGKSPSGSTDDSGTVVFRDLASRAGQLDVLCEGYLPAQRLLNNDDSPTVDVRLVPDGSESGEVIVIVDRQTTDVFAPTSTLEQIDLQEKMGSSVPDTIASEPGVAVAFNGPGAARPTIRGLAGDRVLMLEDGFRTGDLYWSASDHGVMVEPLTAQRIDIVRGPASLIFSGNALGGVVDVVRHDIPQQRQDRVTAEFATMADSATLGVGQGASVRVPVGPVVVRLEESTRRSGDLRTPDGNLENTDLQSFGLAAGASYLPDWGLIGASVRYLDTEYGVPGEFNGELVPGGHPGGANIDARRLAGRLQVFYDSPRIAPLQSLEWTTSGTRYLHDEIEGVIADRRAVGALFELEGLQSNLVARHNTRIDDERRWHGAFGLSGSLQDLVAGGNAPGVRSGDEWRAGVFAFEQLDLPRFSFIAGGRYENAGLSPDDLSDIDVRTTERTIVKPVSSRQFSLLSGSLAAMWNFAPQWRLGVNLARSSRAPNLQELYSDGPHLADFSFDIGSPALAAEVGHGVDVFVRGESDTVSAEAAVFANRIDDFIYYTPTLETVRVFREGTRPRDTPVFEATGVDALFVGAEGTGTWNIGYGVSVEATLSYVRAEQRDTNDPLPFIAPLHGHAAVRYARAGFFGAVEVQGAARQGRVPDAVQIGDVMELPQAPTDGFALLHARAGWSGQVGNVGHTVTARGFNLTDRVWRDHLSRIKDVAPQSGLGLSLTYRLSY